MDYLEKLDLLYELAEKNDIYQVWKRNYEELSVPFKVFADRQSAEIQRILYGYADAGRLMAQSIGNIACKNMEFISHKESQSE